jgi:hypothetical protein
MMAYFGAGCAAELDALALAAFEESDEYEAAQEALERAEVHAARGLGARRRQRVAYELRPPAAPPRRARCGAAAPCEPLRRSPPRRRSARPGVLSGIVSLARASGVRAAGALPASVAGAACRGAAVAASFRALAPPGVLAEHARGGGAGLAGLQEPPPEEEEEEEEGAPRAAAAGGTWAPAPDVWDRSREAMLAGLADLDEDAAADDECEAGSGDMYEDEPGAGGEAGLEDVDEPGAGGEAGGAFEEADEEWADEEWADAEEADGEEAAEERAPPRGMDVWDQSREEMLAGLADLAEGEAGGGGDEAAQHERAGHVRERAAATA